MALILRTLRLVNLPVLTFLYGPQIDFTHVLIGQFYRSITYCTDRKISLHMWIANDYSKSCQTFVIRGPEVQWEV